MDIKPLKRVGASVSAVWERVKQHAAAAALTFFTAALPQDLLSQP